MDQKKMATTTMVFPFLSPYFLVPLKDPGVLQSWGGSYPPLVSSPGACFDCSWVLGRVGEPSGCAAYR